MSLCSGSAGNIQKYICHGHSGVLILPQKPFLTDGSLRQQVFSSSFCFLDQRKKIEIGHLRHPLQVRENKI